LPFPDLASVEGPERTVKEVLFPGDVLLHDVGVIAAPTGLLEVDRHVYACDLPQSTGVDEFRGRPVRTLAPSLGADLDDAIALLYREVRGLPQ
jgi:hypothetical protein